MTILNFDATQIPPDSGRDDPVPAGWYNVMIDESEMKPTKAGDGYRLALRFTILDGQYINRKVFTGLNLKNPNPVAQEIAYSQLSAICHAVGVLQVQDSQQLHGRPLKVKVKVKPASGDYDASNDIVAFKNINEPVGASAQPQGASPPWAQQQQPAQVQQQPWQAPPPVQQPPVQAPPAWQPPTGQPQPWQQPMQQSAPPMQQTQPPMQQAQPSMQQAAPAQQSVPPWMAQIPNGADSTPPWIK